MGENIEYEILGELDAGVSDERQAQAEQLFAQAIGQLATQDRAATVQELSNGDEQDVQAQKKLTEKGFTPFDAAKFSASAIHHHFDSHHQQHEQNHISDSLPPMPYPATEPRHSTNA